MLHWTPSSEQRQQTSSEAAGQADRVAVFTQRTLLKSRKAHKK